MRDSLLDSRGCSRTASFVFEQSGAPVPARGLIILVTKRPELSAILNCATFDQSGPFPEMDIWFPVLWLAHAKPKHCLTVSSRHSCRLTYKFYGVWWLRVASWRCFSRFMVKGNSCSMSLACLLSDWIRFSRKKSCFFWVDRSPSLLSGSYLATLLWRKADEDYFSQKLCVRIKDNKNSPHGKFHRCLFPFSSKLSDLNFASYVLYNLPVLCHASHTVSLGYLWRDCHL